MVTHDTAKRGLAFAVEAFGMPTHTTTLAGIGWIDKRYRYACALRFVADKRAQLAEAPIAVSRSLLPFNPRSLANALEILKDDRPLCAFGFSDKPFADVVIGVFLKAPLATFEVAQATFGRLRSDLLERLTAVRIPLAAAFNVLTRKRFTVAVGRQIDNAQIDAQDTLDIDWFGRFDFASNEQIPLATHQRQIGFPALCGKQFTPSLTTNERNCLSPVECPDRNLGTFEVVGQDAIVVRNRTVSLERALCVSIQLVGIRDFSDTAHHKLRGKVERLAHGLISQPVDRELAECLCFPRHMADIVTGSVGRFKRALEGIRLFRRGEQLDGGSQSHIMIIPGIERLCKYALKWAKVGHSSHP